MLAFAFAQPYRTPKATRDVSQSEKFQSGAGTHRNPKYIKAARGRAALQNIPKRRETRRTPKYIRRQYIVELQKVRTYCALKYAVYSYA